MTELWAIMAMVGIQSGRWCHKVFRTQRTKNCLDAQSEGRQLSSSVWVQALTCKGLRPTLLLRSSAKVTASVHCLYFQISIYLHIFPRVKMAKDGCQQSSLHFIFLKCIDLYWKRRFTKTRSDRKRQRGLASTGLLPKWLPWMELSQSEARSRELLSHETAPVRDPGTCKGEDFSLATMPGPINNLKEFTPAVKNNPFHLQVEVD